MLSAHHTCVLLSLRGVTSVVTTQWHTSQKLNSQLLFELNDLLNSNKSPTESLQYLTTNFKKMKIYINLYQLYKLSNI